MTRWQRRTFGIFALGGGAVGFSITLQQLLAQTFLVNIILMVAIVAIYAWGMWCGLMMLEGKPGTEIFNRRYWLVQIPIVSSPLLSGQLWGGATVSLAIQVWPIQLNYHAQLGAGFSYGFLQRDNPLTLGVNLFALAMTIWISVILEKSYDRLQPQEIDDSTGRS